MLLVLLPQSSPSHPIQWLLLLWSNCPAVYSVEAAHSVGPIKSNSLSSVHVHLCSPSSSYQEIKRSLPHFCCGWWQSEREANWTNKWIPEVVVVLYRWSPSLLPTLLVLILPLLLLWTGKGSLHHTRGSIHSENQMTIKPLNRAGWCLFVVVALRESRSEFISTYIHSTITYSPFLSRSLLSLVQTWAEYSGQPSSDRQFQLPCCCFCWW